MTMARKYVDVIEAEAAIKDLFADMPRIEFMGNQRRWREENEQYLRCLDVIRSLPTADVVEVVRCKDCKHCEWYIRAHYKNGIEVESHECRKYKMAVARDWFCADGERKGNEN